MRCLVRQLTRRPKGVTQKDSELVGDSIRIGRSTENELYLADFRVVLHHATLHSRPGGNYIESGADARVSVNGAQISTARISSGDSIWLGPYDIKVIDAPPDYDLALSVELVRPLSDDLAKLKARTVKSLAATGMSKRRWAWIGFITVLLLFLVLPLLGTWDEPLRQTLTVVPALSERSWLSGDFAAPHRFFAADCKTCHQAPFVRVQDDACLACHKTVKAHADPQRFHFATFAANRCASCHTEHQGQTQLVRSDQQFCASCHADLSHKTRDTQLLDVSDFGRGHPQFRPALLRLREGNETVQRISLTDHPQEQSGLVFTHAKHLDPRGVKSPKGKVVLDCVRCHTPEPGGARLRPIRMTEVCAGCHLLNFDPDNPQRVVPHADVAQVLASLDEYYSTLALKGGYDKHAAPPAVRRLPGKPLNEAQRLEALRWAQQMTARTASELIDKRTCKICHAVTRTPEQAPGWRIAPVRLADHWLPLARFSHAKHVTTACTDCHAARGSKQSSDVLLPGIGKCRECHASGNETARQPSTCLICHGFHVGKQALRASALGARNESHVLP
jgi:predicted CXXCH cytochrome family protein